ncbi:MAG: hypothetical protein KFF72_01540 [Arthrospira sp. SH-MAG29]|nr:hypothetical protein [Arthrospira sp. SH-MAG29]MBS0015049.1 hypothetical protein [Arthrospira sp. SH-MAG29]
MIDISILPPTPAITNLVPVLLAQQNTVPQLDIPYDTVEPNPGMFIGYLIGYLVFSFLSWKIYQRCRVDNAWFAWIPILGTYINFVAGDEDNPILWTILMFIPCVNIIAVIWLIKAWIRICKKLEKSPWLILLCILPFVGSLIFYSYLAFG